MAAFNKLTGSAVSATGIICGVVATAVALILNPGIGIYNSFLALIGGFVDFFLGIIEWVLNAANGGFDSFGDAVANLIGQIIGWFLSLGQVVTTIIDAIFGTDWTSGLESLKGTVTQWGKGDTSITLDRGDHSGIQRIEYGSAFDAGYSFGQGLDDKIGGLFDGSTLDPLGVFDLDNTLDQIGQNTGFTAANTAESAKKLDITSEELKYLRDIAEREAINRFTTAEIHIDQTNHNNIAGGMDVDDIIDEQNQTLFDMVQNALDETLQNTGKLYVLYDDVGRLCLRDINQMKLGLVVDAETGESYSYESGIDSQTYDKVKLYYDNDKTGKRELYVAQDSGNIDRWGVLQYCEQLQSTTGAQARADGLLRLYNTRTRSLTISGAFGDPSDTLVQLVQTTVDPLQNAGEGLGLAPIGHVVRVYGAEEETVDLAFAIYCRRGLSWKDVQEAASAAVTSYFRELARNWADTDGALVVRVAQVESRLLSVTGILDVASTALNGREENLTLTLDRIPVLGTITARAASIS